MTEELRTHFRIAILRALDAAHPMRLTAENVHTGVRLHIACDEEQVERELHDLEDKGFTAHEADAFNAAITRWRRTEDARALLAAKGLASKLD
jgi:hypothetical protein